MKKIIYKYFRINSYLFDTLISNQLFFTSYHQFNDPYDCYMTFFDKISKDDFKMFLESLKIQTETKEIYFKAFDEKPEKFVQPFIEMFKSWINHYGICCFTKGKKKFSSGAIMQTATKEFVLASTTI